MNKTKVKEKAKRLIDNLTIDKAKLILNLIEYLNEKEEWEATKEILSDREMMENIRKSEEDLKAGRMNEFIPWDEVKEKDVSGNPNCFKKGINLRFYWEASFVFYYSQRIGGDHLFFHPFKRIKG